MIKRVMLSSFFQNLIKKTSNPEFKKSIDRNLPIIESVLATGCYCASTQLNSSIPKDRKPALQYQNLTGGLIGVTLAKLIDSFANKHKEKICKELEKLNVPNSKNIIKGTRIAVPIIITSICTRYLASVASSLLSTEMAEKGRKNAK